MMNLCVENLQQQLLLLPPIGLALLGYVASLAVEALPAQLQLLPALLLTVAFGPPITGVLTEFVAALTRRPT